ncbi:hypothetical protein [Pseudomonas sp.]|uniref:hypothetical protein n=1 Tax=Pseudomonas sp. TaxID=306 RepID=UPI0035626757
MHDLTRHSPENGPLAQQLRGNNGNAWLAPMQSAEPPACSMQSISPPIRSISDQGGRQRANTPLREQLEHPARSSIALNSGSQLP